MNNQKAVDRGNRKRDERGSDGGPHYNRLKQAYVLLSHDRRAFIVGCILVGIGVVASLVALWSRNDDTIAQPPSFCWPSIEAAPTPAHAGDTVTVHSRGFGCGYLANDGNAVEYWVVVTAGEGGPPLRFGPVPHHETGAFTYFFTLPASTTPGKWSIQIEGHQQYIVPKACPECVPPVLSPVLTVV
jgi:hypothetical protein